ncbi:hypothetical protein AXF42_Ash015290 [Apostasia shenzhenica]|uniref:Uncharacterized protein n=1 Tax=Apostasia shenzhenica TaxID=1088818 RepID=A0A2I0ALT9_9ASPA|nr:hypothetical protein AXF42_Ash015290 [Apostasia shenzhenica]
MSEWYELRSFDGRPTADARAGCMGGSVWIEKWVCNCGGGGSCGGDAGDGDGWIDHLPGGWRTRWLGLQRQRGSYRRGGYHQFLAEGLKWERVGILRKRFFEFPHGSVQDQGLKIYMMQDV